MGFFLNNKLPVLTAMLKCRAVERIIPEIERVREEGACAVGLQSEVLEDSSKSPRAIRQIFSAIGDLPIYYTHYVRGNTTPGVSWDTAMEQLLFGASLGAALIDVPGDAYLSSDMELATDRLAVERQKSFITEVKNMGCEVLMSSHVLKFADKKTVLSIAEEHFSRGADISKIVTEANSERELRENFEISFELSERYGNKTLFLCNGTHARRHRLFAPTLGSAMYLAAENANTGQMQPTLGEASEILNLVFGGNVK